MRRILSSGAAERCLVNTGEKSQCVWAGVPWRFLSIAAVSFALACGAQAAEIQGVIADWNCVNNMVKNGRAKTLQRDHSCSLMKNFKRQSYGLITDDKKFYRLDDTGKQQVIQVLQDSSDRDNLRVLVRGDLDGNTIKINNLTIL